MNKPDEKWVEEFIKKFVNTHNTAWRPLRGLWVEEVIDFIRKTRQEAWEEEKAINKRAYQWIVGLDTGLSSKVIWSVMMGVETGWASLPHDEDDYGRCIRLLQFIPEWQSRLDEVVEKYPEWKKATEHILASLKGKGGGEG